MKEITIERIRKAEFISMLGIFVLAKLAKSKDPSLAMFSDNANIINIANSVVTYTYCADLLANGFTMRLTEDYKAIKGLYDDAVTNIAKLYKKLDLNDPLSVCAAYQFMYRQGYFSRNKEFEFSSDMKDIAGLYGVDIIRGTGVCRSIAALLIDVYKELGYESHGLAVRVNKGTFDNVKPNIDVDMKIEGGTESKLDLVEIISRVTYMANHEIVEVGTKSGNLLLCPTNCAVLQKEGLKITIAKQSVNKKMIFQPISDLTNGVQFSPKTTLKELRTTYTAPENFEETISTAVERCEKNRNTLKKFYRENQELYKNIGYLADQQHSLVKRIFPIVPTD